MKLLLIFLLIIKITPNDMPIKAKLSVDEDFSLKAKVHEFWNSVIYVHEILDDNSDIGFKKLQVLRESKTSSINLDEFENLPTVKKEIPGVTTEILKAEGASKKNNIEPLAQKESLVVVLITLKSQKIPWRVKIFHRF